MPANKVEIDDAIKEGVQLFELYSPSSISQGKISFNVMELSDELDSSGRKKIKDTGKVSEMDFDFLVYAVGQKPEMDVSTCGASCGDTKLGASTVIEAVADGRKVAFQLMKEIKSEIDFYSSRKKGLLAGLAYEKITAQVPKHLDPISRVKSFAEVESGYKQRTACLEAERCINCGCGAIDDCELRKYSVEYGADPQRFKTNGDAGTKPSFEDLSTQYFVHEPSKCIKCGKCISVCEVVAGASALSFIDRGLDVKVSSNTKNNIKDSSCIMCGMCIDSCPTGSLIEHNTDVVWCDVQESIKECEGCILKCKIKYGISDGKIFRARSVDTPICSIGRWGWTDSYKGLRNYYSGIIKTTSTKIDAKKLADPSNLEEYDCIVSLDYDPKGDNPRVFYEFNRLKNLGRKVEVCNLSEAQALLDKYQKTLLVFNAFDPTGQVLKLAEQAYKVLPVYQAI